MDQWKDVLAATQAIKKRYESACVLLGLEDYDSATLVARATLSSLNTLLQKTTFDDFKKNPSIIELKSDVKKQEKALPSLDHISKEKMDSSQEGPLHQHLDQIQAYLNTLEEIILRQTSGYHAWRHQTAFLFRRTMEQLFSPMMKWIRSGAIARHKKSFAIGLLSIGLVVAAVCGVRHLLYRNHGLIGEYYLDIKHEKLYFKKKDKKIDFNWGYRGISGKYKNYFSIRWTGYLKVDEAGRYDFKIRSDDGARLFINDQRLINDWKGHYPEDRYASMDLTEGLHKIKVDFFELKGLAMIQLSWKKSGEENYKIIDSDHFLAKR